MANKQKGTLCGDAVATEKAREEDGPQSEADQDIGGDLWYDEFGDYRW